MGVSLPVAAGPAVRLEPVHAASAETSAVAEAAATAPEPSALAAAPPASLGPRRLLHADAGAVQLSAVQLGDSCRIRPGQRRSGKVR